MTIPVIGSAKRIEQQFRTGEEPVLVMCSDVNIYVSSTCAHRLLLSNWRVNLSEQEWPRHGN